MLTRLPKVPVLSKGSIECRGSPEEPVTMFLTVVVAVVVTLTDPLNWFVDDIGALLTDCTFDDVSLEWREPGGMAELIVELSVIPKALVTWLRSSIWMTIVIGTRTTKSFNFCTVTRR